MDELQAAIVDNISNAGGEITYGDLYEATAAELRSQLPVALRALKTSGRVLPEVGRREGDTIPLYRLRLQES